MPQRRKIPSLRVLVADDFSDGRELVTEYLTFKGFAVTEATTGTEVLKIARRTLPDVILMDLRMPGVDGWEATRLLKNDPTTQGIFIIAVTAHVFEHETARARESGCDALIAKPFDIVALADALTHVAKNGAAAFDGRGLSLTASKRTVETWNSVRASIAKIALAQEAPISVGEFQILNRSLDDAIAGALTEHARLTAIAHVK
jgi:two-component system cell cycle response regulator DivK